MNRDRNQHSDQSGAPVDPRGHAAHGDKNILALNLNPYNTR